MTVSLIFCFIKGTSTVVTKDNDTVNGDAWRSFSVFVIILLVAMLSSIAPLLIFTHRRGHVTFFGKNNICMDL